MNTNCHTKYLPNSVSALLPEYFCLLFGRNQIIVLIWFWDFLTFKELSIYPDVLLGLNWDNWETQFVNWETQFMEGPNLVVINPTLPNLLLLMSCSSDANNQFWIYTFFSGVAISKKESTWLDCNLQICNGKKIRIRIFRIWWTRYFLS